MNEDQVKEVTKDAVELPQIRVPVRGNKTAADLAAEQVDIEKLRKYVENVFGEIANATGLSEKEVLHVIEDTHVDMLKDVLKDSIHNTHAQAIQEAIKKISLATDLDTEQITHVFAEKKNTNLNDIVNRLHKRSQNNRENLGSPG
jgi:DNA-directed RNA polymerase specialized sigma subunit